MVVLSVGVLVSCCASDLTTRATQVRLVSTEQAHEMEAQCEFVGNVMGTSCWPFWWWGGMSYENALNELLDHAAELGATDVFANLWLEGALRGEAFFCAYCQGPDGQPDRGWCQDPFGQPAEAADRTACLALGGDFQWFAKAQTRADCEVKGGNWITNRDVLRGERDWDKLDKDREKVQ